MNQSIVAFFDGTGTDHAGRSLGFVLKQNDEWLEATHDWVQWAFPLPEASGFNASAPIADAETYAVLAESMSVKALGSIDAAFDRFLSFLKLRPYVGCLADEMPNAPPSWWVADNHNHLRVARCLRFLDCLMTNHHSALAMVLRLALRNLALKYHDGCDDSNLAYWGVLILGREVKR